MAFGSIGALLPTASRRLPDSEHTARPWRIHEIAPDFELEDVWAFRTPGAGPDDFPVMLAALRAADAPGERSLPTRLLFAVRWKLGALLGWDDPEKGVAKRVPSLRERLPADVPATPIAPEPGDLPMVELYELPNESAMELANATVHAVCHLGWVRGATGDYELRMAALVKPNGRFGRLYMAAILPFRYLIVYPAMTRQWERAWRERSTLAAPGR
ncbi:DUF2867 domain-containing protein [Nocardia sp. NPDC057668]|uniref:DUF2867 domain-containing protein n=1 Tax=Nocardia sp. NPDC057668 TaxID=3346202 RepID=UPI003672D178